MNSWLPFRFARAATGVMAQHNTTAGPVALCADLDLGLCILSDYWELPFVSLASTLSGPSALSHTGFPQSLLQGLCPLLYFLYSWTFTLFSLSLLSCYWVSIPLPCSEISLVVSTINVTTTRPHLLLPCSLSSLGLIFNCKTAYSFCGWLILVSAHFHFDLSYAPVTLTSTRMSITSVLSSVFPFAWLSLTTHLCCSFFSTLF